MQTYCGLKKKKLDSTILTVIIVFDPSKIPIIIQASIFIKWVEKKMENWKPFFKINLLSQSLKIKKYQTIAPQIFLKQLELS